MPSSGVHAHEALYYRDDHEYREGLSEFLAPALDSGEPVALAVPGWKLEPLREWLDGALDVELLDMCEVGRNPGRILPVIERLGNKHRGRTLHYVGEPIWPGRCPAAIREAVRHEALINLALRGTRTQVLCPYDASRLDESVLASAERTHPTVVDCGMARPSESYSDAVPPEAELPLGHPPPGAARCHVREGDLSAVRAAVRDYARDTHFNGRLLDDLQIVASELAGNALRHGAPPRQLWVWQTPGKVVCQAENRGAISDPLAGRRNPGQDPNHGMGLWIVHHLSALVEVRSGDRTTIRAHLPVD
ncbi:MAG: sensor histidine kinase [Solirubrobacterales bacterium]|nr:sensor histidine kinase [Solirubrobacterales bacterium]MBV9167941.1 sensor histidine kinase [Solirubrobacterales bacterium]MBV9537289.1 sensor histidine kinase [Solirubrobacterales bacterium]